MLFTFKCSYKHFGKVQAHVSELPGDTDAVGGRQSPEDADQPPAGLRRP